LAAVACADDGPAGPGGITGRANLSRYAAIGNSLTAGYQSGALGETGQSCSYPLLLAQQTGVEEGFEQPLISAPGLSAPGSALGRLQLVSLVPLVIERASPAGQPLNADLPRPYNNLGIPGALGYEALTAESQATSLTGNPFFSFVLRDQGTWEEQVARLDATFVTVFLGSNEVLGYATRGGDPALAPGFPIPTGSFGLVYDVFISNLLRTTDQIVLFNVPDVTAIPFLTTIPPVVVDPVTLQPIRDADSQPIPLIGPNGPLVPGDLVTLNALNFLLQGIGIPAAAGGTGEPLPDSVVLDAAEQAVAGAAVQGYNGVIAQVAAKYGLAVVDIHALLDDIAADGIRVDGQTLTTDFITGGLFSLDGIHPTCKGYGVIANELIAVINAEFGASIPSVSVSALPGISEPAGDLAPAARASSLPLFRGFDAIELPF
jgi:lysophospholipase L1-like esterase